MTTAQQWYTVTDTRALQDAALDVRSITGEAVEIGDAQSALILAPILAPRPLVCIDVRPKKLRDVPNITRVRGSWTAWAAEHEEDTFALVHLAASDYTTMHAQLEWFWPRMAVGGVLCGHDYETAARAVTETLPLAEVQAQVWRAMR